MVGLKRDSPPAAHIGMHSSAQLIPLRICTPDTDESRRTIQAIRRLRLYLRSPLGYLPAMLLFTSHLFPGRAHLERMNDFRQGWARLRQSNADG